MKAKKTGLYALALGALGVVFGDIGTSPLYAFRAIFSHQQLSDAINKTVIYGVGSLVIWSVILVVSVKYIGFIMRANNNGEGGIMALTALMSNARVASRTKILLILLGVAGVSLFYGDSVITPAISVLSAVEGIQVVAPSLHQIIIPVTVVVLAGLFLLQQTGTAIIGRLFGPVMLVWFVVMGAGGLAQVIAHPGITEILLPWTALQFFVEHPGLSFIAMGAVVLAVTGAEALYADMGHFGRKPIAKTWFWIVFPALALNYMGQAALVTHNPEAMANPFYLLFPEVTRIPLIILATFATLIASQAVISGAFSLTRQAVQLKFLPRLIIKHTSNREFGQIYVPFVNWALFGMVVLLVVGFGSSAKLATAYGVAVSGTLAIDTILFLAVARYIWRRPITSILAGAVVFLTVDMIFVTSNLSKILHGGWFPILLALAVFAAIVTWMQGQKIIKQERQQAEGSLDNFVREMRRSKDIARLPGSAVYLSHHDKYTPLALRATIDRLHELHEHIVIVNIETKSIPHVPEDERVQFDALGYEDDGISHINLSFGFKDTPNVPKTLQDSRSAGKELDFDLDNVSYFVSNLNIVPTHRKNLVGWQKILYVMMSKNAASPTDYYKLPLERTVEMSSYVKL
jgi:KUP system potassium uptake protein